MSVDPVDPSVIFGGTWEAWGAGRVPVGVDTAQTEFDTVEKIGGENTHKLTNNEMASHVHSLNSHTHTIAHTHTTPATSISSSGAHNHANWKYDQDVASGSAKNRANGAGGTTASNNLFASNSGAHTHTVPQMTTSASSATNSGAASGNTGSACGNQPHNNLQPYITCYMWKRVA